MKEKSKIVIEKNIPIPEKMAGRPSTSPIYTMEIGDSFWCKSYSIPKKVKDTGFKFTARVETKDGVKGFRVWRVA